jgi:hypothetical protein
MSRRVLDPGFLSLTRKLGKKPLASRGGGRLGS